MSYKIVTKGPPHAMCCANLYGFKDDNRRPPASWLSIVVQGLNR